MWRHRRRVGFWIALAIFFLCFRPSRLGGAAGLKFALFRRLIMYALFAPLAADPREILSDVLHGSSVLQRSSLRC